MVISGGGVIMSDAVEATKKLAEKLQVDTLDARELSSAVVCLTYRRQCAQPLLAMMHFPTLIPWPWDPWAIR